MAQATALDYAPGRRPPAARLRVDVLDHRMKVCRIDSIAELARRVGIHRVRMSEIRGGAQPSVGTALRIAQVTRTSVEKLFEPVVPAESRRAA